MSRVAGFAIVALGAGCTSAADTRPVRALQHTGSTAFVCLAAPGSTDVGVALSKCGRTRTPDFSIPHLYALTVQPIRGEVAVVDLTTTDAALVDSDPATPGTSFLPVGASPTDLVSTPGGMATFVAVAEPGFEGIFALPSKMIRGSAPLLSHWPACALPATPGHIELVIDPPSAGGSTRPTCDAAYGTPDPATTCGANKEPHCHGDLARDVLAAGKAGRYKLVVTLPKEGGIAIIDAQSLLDQDPGAFKPCLVERFLPLKSDVKPIAAPPPPAQKSCVPPPSITAKAVSYKPLPGGLALAERTAGGAQLFVADRGMPAIHRIDMPTPCEPAELEPLATSSAEDPARVVTTNRVSVSPLTFDLQRFLYAIDEADGSIMMYDVSDGSTNTKPLARARPHENPFQPPDRIRFGSPPREIVLLRHSADQPDDSTGAALAVRCDPTAGAIGPGTKYRTLSDFTGGAGPRKLRGVFGFAVLASGNVVVLDVDDFDAPCRGPKDHHSLFGCDDKTLDITGASGEYSCKVVAPHRPRSAGYLAFRDAAVTAEPGIQAFPLLFDIDGSVKQVGTAGTPRMRATTPVEPPVKLDNEKKPQPQNLRLPVSNKVETIDYTTGCLKDACVMGKAPAVDAHTLVMNAEDPRAHILSQAWTITYEGSLPGFGSHFADLLSTKTGFELRDPAVDFCQRGVLGASAVADWLIEREGKKEADAKAAAEALADYVQIISDTPVITDKHWSQQTKTCVDQGASFSSCQQLYGSSINPLPSRDFRIAVAQSGVLEIVPRKACDQNKQCASGSCVEGFCSGNLAGDLPSPALKCCFPHLVQFRVRAGRQWLALGSQVGFLHHTDAAADGVCRPKCDTALARLNGRVRPTDTDGPVNDQHPRALVNPFFRLSIGPGTVKRDMQFRFTTQGAFSPLQLSIAPDKVDVQPTTASFLPVTNEIVISDGSLEGLSLIDVGALAISRKYQ